QVHLHAVGNDGDDGSLWILVGAPPQERGIELCGSLDVDGHQFTPTECAVAHHRMVRHGSTPLEEGDMTATVARCMQVIALYKRAVFKEKHRQVNRRVCSWNEDG